MSLGRSDWRARDAEQIPMPAGYSVAWPSGDPLRAPPGIARGAIELGLGGLFARLDLGDVAAGRCLVAVAARTYARWPESSVARARGPERIARDRVFEALGALVDELHVAPDESPAASRRGPLVAPERLAEDWVGSLRRLLHRAGAPLEEARDVASPDELSADPATEATWAEVIDLGRKKRSLAASLAELNRAWLGPSAPSYDADELGRLLSDAALPPGPARAERLLGWLDPRRLHVKTACFILRLEADVSVADSYRLLAGAGFRAREGRPFSKNSVSACASMAKKALREVVTAPRCEP